MNDNTTPETTAQPEVTPTAAATTPQQAATIDTNAIITQAATKAEEAASKKMEAVFKSMLEQKGLDDTAIQSMLAEYKAKQVTPEQTIQKLQGDIAERDAKLTAFERREILRDHGLTDAEEIEIMSIRIDRLMTDGKDFATAAQEYFTANPRPTKAPATVVPGVTGGTPLTQSESETMRAAYQKAAKDGDRATMSFLTRQAKEKNITLY